MEIVPIYYKALEKIAMNQASTVQASNESESPLLALLYLVHNPRNRSGCTVGVIENP